MILLKKVIGFSTTKREKNNTSKKLETANTEY